MPPSFAPPTCDLTISIVSLNTRDLLAACLRSVFTSRGVAFEVHVIDNGSTDGSAETVARDFPAVSLVRNQSNRGFAAANNIAVNQATGRYVLLLNPDTEIGPDALRAMVAFMDAHPAAGICGPKINFPDGRFQSCGYRFPTLLSEVQQSKAVGRLMRAVVGPASSVAVEHNAFEVDWVDGACLLIRRDVVEQVGPLDEQYFLYAEELDWCFCVRKAGWSVYAVPSVSIVHHQGQSSAQMSDFSLAYLIETRLRFYRKHYGLLSAITTSLVYVAGCLRQFSRNRHRETVKLRATLRWWRSLLQA
jgi:N-acetylglucosaminyl-diphospho-decaprenol L-rhamnosyltransferase